jgi:hypothetical protein
VYVQELRLERCGNGGAGAVRLAMHTGAAKIVLLGYDCGYKEGEPAHWHEDHTGELPNAKMSHRWPGQTYEQCSEAMLRNVKVLNASRKTLLSEAVPRVTLEEALCV